MREEFCQQEFREKVIIHHATDQQAMLTQVVSETRQAINETLAREQHFVMAVSGGSSPKPLFKALADDAAIPWGQGVITLVDERFVPPQHQESNEKLVREHLLVNHAASARFVGLFTPGCSLAEAVKTLNGLPDLARVDIGILGMGMDGHTASLFPCSPELPHNLSTVERYVSATPATAPHERISMSASALCEIPELWLFLPGGEKFARFQRIIAGDDPESPIAPLLRQRNTPMKVFTCP
jgi:6-phosphogluconolactonase